MVDGDLAQHGEVLNLRLAQGRGVGGDQNELRLAGPKALEGAAVAEDDLSRLDDTVATISRRKVGRDEAPYRASLLPML